MYVVMTMMVRMMLMVMFMIFIYADHDSHDDDDNAAAANDDDDGDSDEHINYSTTLSFILGTSVNDAKGALQELGATGNVHPGFHASWAFMGYTGPEKVKWAKTVTQARYKGPSVISEMITTPAAELELSKKLKYTRRQHLFDIFEPSL
jgi:hypothetical protein